jgi:hypothetical protein
LLPFYAGNIQAADKMGYWAASRRVSSWEDDLGKIVAGTEVDLHVVDQGLDLKWPTRAVLNVQVLCTPRPSRCVRHCGMPVFGVCSVPMP